MYRKKQLSLSKKRAPAKVNWSGGVALTFFFTACAARQRVQPNRASMPDCCIAPTHCFEGSRRRHFSIQTSAALKIASWHLHYLCTIGIRKITNIFCWWVSTVFFHFILLNWYIWLYIICKRLADNFETKETWRKSGFNDGGDT